MKTISLIAAVDRELAIGRDNQLPWHLPDDLKHFKNSTKGRPVLMGRKTALSLGRALPGRLNLVMSRSGEVPFEGMEHVQSIDHALEKVPEGGELMVIGGGEIYTLALPHAHTLYITEVDTLIENPDAFFPLWDKTRWKEVCRETPTQGNNEFPFSFVKYQRI